MPIYEYGCDKCGHEFEAEQRITDEPLKTCPECRGRRVRRLISRTSFVLRGGGWYSDLYASPGSKSGNGKSDDAGEKPSGSGSEGKSQGADAAPAAKSEGSSPSTGETNGKKKKKKGSKAAAA